MFLKYRCTSLYARDWDRKIRFTRNDDYKLEDGFAIKEKLSIPHKRNHKSFIKQGLPVLI